MLHRLVVLGWCALAMAGSSAHAAAPTEDWPQFRGPTGQGISTATDVPVEWSATKNVAWKLEIPGHGWSSPALAGGRLYLTTAANGAWGTSLYVVCVDAGTGKVVWDTEVLRPDPGPVRAMHPKNSPASPTPIVTADRVYVHFGHLGTAALDLSGKVVWHQTSLSYPPVHGNGGSPILLNDTLIFNCDGGSNPFIAALDAKTGDVKWKTPRQTSATKTFSFCTPLPIEINGATQVISPASGFVGSYDPATGKELWRVRYGQGYSVVPRPVYADGLLFIGSGFDVPVLYAIKPDGAQGDSTSTHVAWTDHKAAPRTPSPLVIGEELYTVSDAGIATCFDAVSGAVQWTHRLDGEFSSSPVAAEGRIYLQTETGVGYVLQAGKEFKLLASNDLGEHSLASYAVTDHALFIRTESHLFRISKPTG